MDDSMATEAPRGDGFSPTGTLQFTAPSRLPKNACCPDKALVVIVTSDDTREKLSLWSLSGARKWEIDFVEEGSERQSIVAIAWSPDCTFIVPPLSHTCLKEGQYSLWQLHMIRLALQSIQFMMDVLSAHLYSDPLLPPCRLYCGSNVLLIRRVSLQMLSIVRAYL
jgi:hypothetical protein